MGGVGSGVLLKAEGEDGIFEGAGPVESLAVLCDRLGEIGFEGADLSEGFGDGVAVLLEGRPIFRCVNDDLAGKAVSEGIQGRTFLAFRRKLDVVAARGESSCGHLRVPFRTWPRLVLLERYRSGVAQEGSLDGKALRARGKQIKTNRELFRPCS